METGYGGQVEVEAEVLDKFWVLALTPVHDIVLKSEKEGTKT